MSFDKVSSIYILEDSGEGVIYSQIAIEWKRRIYVCKWFIDESQEGPSK